MTTKFKKSFSPMLICWNDIKIHLGFEDSYFVPPPITRSGSEAENISQEKECPLMFVHKVSMLFSYSRDASIFVLCLQTGGSETENTSQKSNVKAILELGYYICYP